MCVRACVCVSGVRCQVSRKQPLIPRQKFTAVFLCSFRLVLIVSLFFLHLFKQDHHALHLTVYTLILAQKVLSRLVAMCLMACMY